VGDGVAEQDQEPGRVVVVDALVVHQQSRVIIDDAVHVGFAAGDLRAVQGIRRPDLIDPVRFESAERLRGLSVWAGVELQGGEVTLQGAF
jgi:hypothetical protein